MFETAELGRKVDKEEYRRRAPELRTALLEVQERLKTADFPVLLLIAGVDGAGKGETVNLLLEWLDPRYLSAHAFGEPSDEERERPPFWRFWRVLPPKGRMGIFFGSWYTDPILDRVQHRIKQRDLDTRMDRICAFEKSLVDGGALLLKLWFHISKKAQRHRFHQLEADPRTAWRVTETDREHYRRYDRFRSVCERVLRLTSTGEAPWVVIEGEDERYRSLAVGEHVLASIRKRLDHGAAGTPVRSVPALPCPPPLGCKDFTILDRLDLGATLDEKPYQDALVQAQGRLNGLWRRFRQRGRSALLVFEGWDAAGKGGAIRRITPAIDAREYRIIPVAAPTEEERQHHYLWRFWRHLPRAGMLTIFDRSWYGRVLVERIEGFCREEEWIRGYSEINEFEAQIHEHGSLVVKFWLHIDKREQLRRFRDREGTPFKRHKINPEDYRNRKKWDAYLRAANDMVTHTSTEFAPWHLIPANDKRLARIRILETLCDRLETA